MASCSAHVRNLFRSKYPTSFLARITSSNVRHYTACVGSVNHRIRCYFTETGTPADETPSNNSDFESKTENVKSENLESTDSITTQIHTDRQKRDPFPLFIRSDVQQLLSNITGFNLNKIFKYRQVPAEKPSYELLTKEMVDKMQSKAERKGQRKIQMPPFMRPWPSRERILSVDSDIAGLLESRLVAVDITYGTKTRNRTVVIRQQDGVLRTANWEEHTRFMQFYFPRNGRKLFRPRMFESGAVENLLHNGKSCYLLDRACIQFEPDDPLYISMTHRVYEYINENSLHQELRSTRHFGPMAFYLVWYKKVDKLLLDMLLHDLIEDARNFIELYHMIHPDCPSAELITNAMHNLEAIEIFSKHNAEIPNSGAIERALQTYKELQLDQSQ